MAEQQKQPQNEVEPVTPGTVVTPGGAPITQDASRPAPAAPEPVPPQPEPKPQPAQPAQQQQAPPAPPQPAPEPPQLQIHASTQDEPDVVKWTASEFVAHDKSSEWYTLLVMGTVAAAGLMYAINRDFITVVVVLVAGLLFGVYGAHKPKQLEYRVDMRGVGMGGKFYGYDEFQSFSIIPEGAFSGLVLMPLKRFAVPINIYYAPEDEDKIMEIVSSQLPYEQRRRDAVDSLMRKVRF